MSAASNAAVGSFATTTPRRRLMRLCRATADEGTRTRASPRARSSAASLSRPRRWTLMAVIALARLLSVNNQDVSLADGLSRS
jgi:hypothetical protein